MALSSTDLTKLLGYSSVSPHSHILSPYAKNRENLQPSSVNYVDFEVPLGLNMTVNDVTVSDFVHPFGSVFVRLYGSRNLVIGLVEIPDN